MANRKAQLKTIRTNAIRRDRNRKLRSALHTQLVKLDNAIESGDQQKAQDELRNSLINIDKSESKGILHKNTAARKKSRISKRVAAMGSKSS